MKQVTLKLISLLLGPQQRIPKLTSWRRAGLSSARALPGQSVENMNFVGCLRCWARAESVENMNFVGCVAGPNVENISCLVTARAGQSVENMNFVGCCPGQNVENMNFVG